METSKKDGRKSGEEWEARREWAKGGDRAGGGGGGGRGARLRS